MSGEASIVKKSSRRIRAGVALGLVTTVTGVMPASAAALHPKHDKPYQKKGRTEMRRTTRDLGGAILGVYQQAEADGNATTQIRKVQSIEGEKIPRGLAHIEVVKAVPGSNGGAGTYHLEADMKTQGGELKPKTTSSVFIYRDFDPSATTTDPNPDLPTPSGQRQYDFTVHVTPRDYNEAPPYPRDWYVSANYTNQDGSFVHFSQDTDRHPSRAFNGHIFDLLKLDAFTELDQAGAGDPIEPYFPAPEGIQPD